MKNILKTKNAYKHEPVKIVKIQIQDVRNECKHKASNNIREKYQKTICKDVSSVENNTIIESNDVSLIRMSIYYERRKLLPVLPKSLKDALNFFFLNCDILTGQNKKIHQWT
jgi:hypothetical protein